MSIGNGKNGNSQKNEIYAILLVANIIAAIANKTGDSEA